jgi:hypothetical protein
VVNGSDRTGHLLGHSNAPAATVDIPCVRDVVVAEPRVRATRNRVEDLDELIGNGLVEPSKRYHHARREIAFDRHLQVPCLLRGEPSVRGE